MSSRTKGFFEQDHKNKPRPAHWHRNSTGKAPLGDSTNTTAPPKPAIPATSQAKSKLKAYSFVTGHADLPRLSTEGKENAAAEAVPGAVEAVAHAQNAGPSSAPSSAPIQAKPAESNPASDNASRTPSMPHANTFPCTPGARLSLEDLIGDIDETRQPQPKEASPEEQLTWIPNSSSSRLTPNRRRKRARSSSPSCPNTSSQPAQNSAFFAEKQTPEADPVTDLWQRLYGNSKEIGDPLKLPDLNHLALQASPRPLETPVKSGGLRRWASTGNDWPASRSKKRKTHDSSKLSLVPEGQVESTGRSKVAAWVEKIQGDLATQKLGQPRCAAPGDSPSSSNPLPDTNRDLSVPQPNVSPLEQKQNATLPRPPPFQKTLDLPRDIPRMKQPLAPSRPATAQERALPPQEHPPMSNVSVPFNSDAINSATLHLKSKMPLPAFKRPSISRTPSVNKPMPPPVAKPPTVPAEDLDEFGDDMEFSNEDLDELMSQVPLEKRSLHQIPAHPIPPPQQIARVQHAAQIQQKAPAVMTGDDDDDDEFGCEDLDEDSFMEAELQATQGHRSPRKRSPRKSPSPRKRPCPSKSQSQQVSSADDTISVQQTHRRFSIKQVVDGEYSNDKGRRCPERVLLAEEARTKKAVAITLRGSWCSTSVSPGNIVHVSCLPGQPHRESTSPGQIEIDDREASPLLIVHPDHMLSATTVADSFDCIRKAVLQDRIKATSENNKPMVYGKILHEIFQQALSGNQWENDFLVSLVDKTVQAHVEGLWELGMRDTVLATEEINAKMGELAAWATAYVATEPSSNAIVKDRQGDNVWLSVSKLIAIEEHVWSPQYGLKGNIDATIQATLRDDPRKSPKKVVTPFEVKTGRTTQSPAHRAQTALYTLLLSDRYNVSVKAGVLYYLESSDMTRIAPPANEIRQMVQQRNRLASYIHRAKYPTNVKDLEASVPQQSWEMETSGLPAMLRNPFKCGKCYAQQSCFTYHALVEDGTAETAGMVDDGRKNHALVWSEAVGHLLASSALSKDKGRKLKDWFAKWDQLLTFEESATSRFRKELWTMSSAEREAAGRCVGNLVVEQDLSSTAASVASTLVDGIEGGGGKINRFAYVFARPNGRSGSSFAEGNQLTVGEPVVVSSEQGQWALANGYVIAVGKSRITVAVDRKLGSARDRLASFDPESNQVFRGIMDVAGTKTTAAINDTMTQTHYRLDKDEFSNGLALVRNNLVTLMSSHPVHVKLREQIIFDASPKFASGSSALPVMKPSQLGDMNEDQAAAVAKVLSAQDYALILGMPGTGKTTTIAHVIRALLAEGKSILLTSFTHTAVDNILLKIRDVAPAGSILRLGVPAKINAQVQQFCHLAATPKGSIDEIDAVYAGSQIVATTCMGTSHALFTRRKFDVCIVDEASQITLPTSLGPLLHARRFVLVGDHFQLPPLVQNAAALEGGLDESLFRVLSERRPEAVVELGRQYRMCEEIMSLANALIYSGRLKCGNEAVARRTLHLPKPGGLHEAHIDGGACSNLLSASKTCWLEHVTYPANKVVLANTDAIGPPAREALTAGKNITNALEASLTASLVLTLLAQGVAGRDIGIITPFRSQLALLRQVFKASAIPADVEIDSADRFQGRDKEVVLLSMVRSNDLGIVGKLLADWRRVNVAFTRARSKLVVLGSKGTLSRDDVLGKFVALVEENGWSVDLPKSLGQEDTACLKASIPVTSPVVARQGGAKTSPVKRKLFASSPVKVLGTSKSGANRSPAKSSPYAGRTRKPGKIISRSGGKVKNKSMKLLQEQVAMDIFEDLTGDEF